VCVRKLLSLVRVSCIITSAVPHRRRTRQCTVVGPVRKLCHHKCSFPFDTKQKRNVPRFRRCRRRRRLSRSRSRKKGMSVVRVVGYWQPEREREDEESESRRGKKIWLKSKTRPNSSWINGRNSSPCSLPFCQKEALGTFLEWFCQPSPECSVRLKQEACLRVGYSSNMLLDECMFAPRHSRKGGGERDPEKAKNRVVCVNTQVRDRLMVTWLSLFPERCTCPPVCLSACPFQFRLFAAPLDPWL